MKSASILVLLAVAAQAQMQRGKFASVHVQLLRAAIGEHAMEAGMVAGREGDRLRNVGSLWKVRPGDTTAYELTATQRTIPLPPGRPTDDSSSSRVKIRTASI